MTFDGARVKIGILVWTGILGLLLVPVKESNATQYKLNTWNTSDKSTSNKYVNIDSGKDSKGNTTLSVSIRDDKGYQSPNYLKDISFKTNSTSDGPIKDSSFGSFDNKLEGGTRDGYTVHFSFGKVVDFKSNEFGNIFMVHTDFNKDGYSEGVSCNKRSVPEPSSLLLLGSGLIGLAFWGRKKVKL